MPPSKPTAVPILLCGCHGAGTSYTAKLLRHSGLFMGADAGPLHARKVHESTAFTNANKALLQPFGDKHGFDPACVTAAIAAFSDADRVRVCAEQQVRLDPILAAFWAGTDPQSLWGWKDPRNSLTFPVWKSIFPDARAVVLSKAVDQRPSRSLSGRWFREVASPEIRVAYMRPWWLSQYPDTLTVTFEAVTTNHRQFNTLLAYCGLSQTSETEFRTLLEATGLER